MENNRMTSKKLKLGAEPTVESLEQVAVDELDKAKARFVRGRSIDRGNPEDEEANIQSDDEGMIEEIVTTVEEDKDLECKVKKKIETKKTIAQDPDTHHTITKVVKTEVTEITRTITINDQHDLERAKRELGIDDVNRLLPSASWVDHPRLTEVRETHYEPKNEIVTSKDFPTDSPVKQLHPEEKPVLAEATTAGRGPVTETIVPVPPVFVEPKKKPTAAPKKKKKSKFCSCTRAVDDEPDKPIVKTAVLAPPAVTPASVVETHIQGQQLISSDAKQLIVEKKPLLIEYIHSKIFAPANLFATAEADAKGRKVSSRILDLLRYDRCQSWSQMSEQLNAECADYVAANVAIQPIVNTYYNLFTTKQSNLLNTFATIHNASDIENIHQNNDYLNILQSYLHERDQQAERVITAADEPLTAEVTPDAHAVEHTAPIYDEAHLSKMLADISQHKPITLAEAIAYEYIDLEDPKLALSNETILRIKNLFHPVSDATQSNLIRVKRSGEHLADINLAETNPFERLNIAEPYVYQLQQSFEPTLDFSEKQFRSLAEAILNHKEQYDQLQFDVARTSLPAYDAKDASINDVSQSDSGYSMTTATHESLASKIKIEFEPVHRDEPVAPKRDDLDGDEKIDLDKATQEQLDKYELHPDIIQIIKSDYHGSDKTVGQAILSRELRLDSTDPNDVSYLHSLGIHKEQTRVLTALFFPKHSRVIAYSPEPGRFVEAQTTYNPDYAGYKTDTTIIQIQEKQLSSDHLAMQRSIHDDRTSPNLSQQMTESETIISSPALSTVSPTSEIAVHKEKTPPPLPSPPAPVVLKKRKSSGHGGLLSCFRSKKPKAGTEQQGQATVKPTILISEPSGAAEVTKPAEERSIVDYSLHADGRRIYIDAFRDRPGLDMSYRPDDFDNRFVLPVSKPAIEYERPLTPEVKPIVEQVTSSEHEVVVHAEPEIVEQIAEVVPVETEADTIEAPSDEPAAITVEPINFPPAAVEQEITAPLEPTEVVQHEVHTHLEPRPATIEPVHVQSTAVEHKTHAHLEPRPATIEPLHVQPEKTPIVIPAKTKKERPKAIKKPAVALHGAPVCLPPVELVEPGPTPTLPSGKGAKSGAGLCASCFGAKAAEKKKKKGKKGSAAAPIPVPMESKKSLVEEKKEERSPVIAAPPAPPLRDDAPILPRVNIDTFKERNFQKSYESLPKSPERFDATITPTIEHQYQSASTELIPPSSKPGSNAAVDGSVFSRVNIDTFKERTFDRSFESLPKSQERLAITPTSAEAQFPSLTNASTPSPSKAQPGQDTSLYSKVNIDTFKERTFQKSSESLPKSTERIDTIVEKPASIPSPDQSREHLPASELAAPAPKTPTSNDASAYSRVNIDTFKERTFDRSFESLPKSQERLNAAVTASDESGQQMPASASLESSAPPPKTRTTDDLPDYSKVNIDTFRERTFDKSFESRPKSQERLEAAPSSGEPESISIAPPKVQSKQTGSPYASVNIDTFKERTFDKSYESLPKSQERLNAATTPEEPHHHLPTNQPLPAPTKVQSTENVSAYSRVNIDTFKERTFQKSFESLPKSQEQLNGEVQKPFSSVVEAPHYQQPVHEPVSSITTTRLVNSSVKDESIYSKVNIDSFKERTFDRTFESLPKQATPTADSANAFQPATPSVETQTAEQRISREGMAPPTSDLQKSSGDFLPNELAEKKEKGQQVTSEIASAVAVTDKKQKQKKTKRAKTDKKPSFLSTIFRSSDRKTKVPALHLPPVERDLSPSNRLRQQDSDPLHVPANDLPELDLPLPTYSRPEVNMTSGSIKQSSEFAVPVIHLPAIPDLSLPESDDRTVESTADLMKVPNVQLPDLQQTLNEQKEVKMPTFHFEWVKTEETAVTAEPVAASPTEKASPVESEESAKVEAVLPTISSEESDVAIKAEPLTIEEKYKITDIQQSEVPVVAEKQTKADFEFQLPSPEPILSLPVSSQSKPPSFDDDVPSTPPKIVPAVQYPAKQAIESKPVIPKKSSPPALCSCFGSKAAASKQPAATLAAPKASLPAIDMPVPSSNVASALKTKGALRAPGSDLPPMDLPAASTGKIGLASAHPSEKKQKLAPSTEAVVPTADVSVEKPPRHEDVPSKPAVVVSDASQPAREETKAASGDAKKSSFAVNKAPALHIPKIDLSASPKTDAYLPSSKADSSSISEHIQSRSDSGLEAVHSSQLHPSSTFGTNTTLDDVPQLPSISSGLGSEILDNMTAKGYSLPDIQAPEPTPVPKNFQVHSTRHEMPRKISLSDEMRTRLFLRRDQLKTCLNTELAQSIDGFSAPKDQQALDKVLTHAIDLVQERKVTTYSDLRHELTVAHKDDAFLVEPTVRSLYFALEKQGLDNLDKPEFPLAIRDMVRLPAKQTHDTVTHLNKEATTTYMTKETSSPVTAADIALDTTPKPINAARSCLTCGRSKSKNKSAAGASPIASSGGLLDERRRSQLTTHRTDLGNVLRDHIQGAQPPIRKFADHPKESEKIVRKTLTLLTQPKVHSYEQVRNDLKTEHKQSFYLVDPIVDVVRDTLDHCDVTQMTEKTNLDILDANITQTSRLYNNQQSLLTPDEVNAFKSDQLSWLSQHLATADAKDKKLTKKQSKELNKILARNTEILASGHISTWDELAVQLKREYPKANDLCDRSVDLVKQAQKDGLFSMQHAPVQDKRRPSSLITDRARQNLKSNRKKIISSLQTFFSNNTQPAANERHVENYLTRTFHYLEEQKQGQFKSYHDLKEQLKKDFHKNKDDQQLIEQIVDVVEQAHATNQFDDVDKPEVQILMKDRLAGKPLVIKEMYVSLPSRPGAYGMSRYTVEETTRHMSSSAAGDQTLNSTTISHRVARGLSWREANERARILFYRGKHPAIHYDEQSAAFDVRMVMETASGGTREIPVTDSDVHELLNSCGVQWDGVNIISLVDHSEDVVRAAEQAALRVIREKGIVDLRTPPSTRNLDAQETDENPNGTVTPSADADATSPSS